MYTLMYWIVLSCLIKCFPWVMTRESFDAFNEQAWRNVR